MGKLGNKISEVLADILIAVEKRRIKDRIDEIKLRESLISFIEDQQKYNDVCDKAAEMNFFAILEYIKDNLLDDVENLLTEVSPQKRGLIRDQIINKACDKAMALMPEARKRVEHLISACLEIIKSSYKKAIDKKDYILIQEAVDSINENTHNEVTTVSEQINELKSLLLKGSLDPKHMTERYNNCHELAKNDIQEILYATSKQHPLAPLYGCGYNDGLLFSKELCPEARIMYPSHYKLSGPIKVGNRYFEDPNINPVDYAYRHQLSLVMDIKEAKKYLGDIEDPYQDEAKKLIGKECNIPVPQFPPAFPCSVIVDNHVFFDYILLRTQEILDDNVYVLNNKEQSNTHLVFEVRIKLSKMDLDSDISNKDAKITRQSAFKINIKNGTNTELLNYMRFMKKISEGNTIRIHLLGIDQDIIAGGVNDVSYNTGFHNADEEIDFLERICEIENYFNTSINIEGEIIGEDYNTVMTLSEYIRKDEIKKTWETFNCSGTICDILKQIIKDLDGKPSDLTYIGHVEISLFGVKLDVDFMQIYKEALLQDYDKVVKEINQLKEGETINLVFKSTGDKVVINTINVPEEYR